MRTTYRTILPFFRATVHGGPMPLRGVRAAIASSQVGGIRLIGEDADCGYATPASCAC